MIYYLYDDKTGEYTGKTEARVDKLESEKQGKVIYLKPRNATEKEPPEKKEYKTAFWNGEKWVLVQDYRGLNMFNPKTGEEKQVIEPGTLPQGFYPYTGNRLFEFYNLKKEKGILKFEPRELTIDEKNDLIRKERKARMIEEADSLFYDYVEAAAKGEDKAENLKKAWLNKKEQIRNELPYIVKSI